MGLAKVSNIHSIDGCSHAGHAGLQVVQTVLPPRELVFHTTCDQRCVLRALATAIATRHRENACTLRVRIAHFGEALDAHDSGSVVQPVLLVIVI